MNTRKNRKFENFMQRRLERRTADTQFLRGNQSQIDAHLFQQEHNKASTRKPHKPERLDKYALPLENQSVLGKHKATDLHHPAKKHNYHPKEVKVPKAYRSLISQAEYTKQINEEYHSQIKKSRFEPAVKQLGINGAKRAFMKNAQGQIDYQLNYEKSNPTPKPPKPPSAPKSVLPPNFQKTLGTGVSDYYKFQALKLEKHIVLIRPIDSVLFFWNIYMKTTLLWITVL